jgi:hypothetical protein
MAHVHVRTSLESLHRKESFQTFATRCTKRIKDMTTSELSNVLVKLEHLESQFSADARYQATHLLGIVRGELLGRVFRA